MAGIAQLDTLPTKVAKQKSRMLKDLETLVRMESPTSSRDAVNEVANAVGSWAQELGGRVKRHRGRSSLTKGYGDALEVGFPASDGKKPGKPVLLLGHLDTVWDVGTLLRMPWRQHGGRLYGPGVYDMKAGVVMGTHCPPGVAG